MQSSVWLSFNLLSFILLSIIVLSILMHSVIMLNFIMFGIIMLTFVMQGGMMLRVPLCTVLFCWILLNWALALKFQCHNSERHHEEFHSAQRFFSTLKVVFREQGRPFFQTCSTVGVSAPSGRWNHSRGMLRSFRLRVALKKQKGIPWNGTEHLCVI